MNIFLKKINKGFRILALAYKELDDLALVQEAQESDEDEREEEEE